MVAIFGIKLPQFVIMTNVYVWVPWVCVCLELSRDKFKHMHNHGVHIVKRKQKNKVNFQKDITNHL